MDKGNISLKLSSVNYTDAGNYICFIPKLHSQVRRGYLQLIVEAPTPHAENKGSRTEDGSNPDKTGCGTGCVIGIVIGCVIAAIAVIAGIVKAVRFMCKKRNQQRGPNEGPNEVDVQQPNTEIEEMLKTDAEFWTPTFTHTHFTQSEIEP